MDLYKRIRSNAWHPSASVARVIEEAERCSCFAQGSNCSTSECINRTLLIECSPQTCECGERCANQRLQRAKLPRTKVVHVSDAKGYGMVAVEAISAGALVAEYIAQQGVRRSAGEVIGQSELKRRMRADYAAMRHTYIMTYTRGLVLDATVRGGLARFINHSCGPNCETQKWIVKGETRVGIFARRRIEAGEELTYDYQLQWNGTTQVRCECGAANCSGWLGGNRQQRLDVFALADSDEDGVEDGLYEADGYGGVTKVQQLGAGGAAALPPDLAGVRFNAGQDGVPRRPHSAEDPAALDSHSSDEQLLDMQLPGRVPGSDTEADETGVGGAPVGRASIEGALRACNGATRYPHTRHDDLVHTDDAGAEHEACQQADAQYEAQLVVVADLLEAIQAVGGRAMPEAPVQPLGRLRSLAVRR